MVCPSATQGYDNHPPDTRALNREYLQNSVNEFTYPKNLIMPNEQEKGVSGASGLKIEDIITQSETSAVHDSS